MTTRLPQPSFRRSLTPLALLAAGAAVQAQHIGPSTTTAPYVLPSQPWLETTSILTVGDSVNSKPDGTPYRLVGIPDGLGAYSNGDGTFTALMNHELGSTLGIPRAHGSAGAFVSKWVIDTKTFEVKSGSDLIQSVQKWDNGTSTWVPAAGTVQNAIGRLCSADLPLLEAFYNPITGLGTRERIFMNGEEIGAEGRAFGTVVSTGTAYELPALGKFSWENSIANPGSGDKTIVVGLDDSSPGQVYFYEGTKKNDANPIVAAGLSDGNLWGLKVPSVAFEDRSGGLDGSPAVGEAITVEFFNKGNVTAQTGAQLQASSAANGVTEFLRPEDGVWNPSNPKEFFFVTTDRFDQVKDGSGTQIGRTRLYSLTIDDLGDFSKGGTIKMLLDGTEPIQMLDNMTITKDGVLLLQEDPGRQDYLAKIWGYDLASGSLTEYGKHNPQFFQPGAPGLLTRDEESSGIIDITDIIGATHPTYLFDVQAHYTIPGELVEGGQLLVMQVVPETSTVVAGGVLAAGLGAAALRRRKARAQV